MDEMKLNIESSGGMEKNLQSSSIDALGSVFLADVPLHNIAKTFSSFGSENRVTVVPIGFPQAGKSMLLSSLFRYAVRGQDTHFNVNLENKFPFNNGRRAADIMINYFEKGKIYSTTRKGTLDLVGLSINPTHSKLPRLDLAFLDLAGEDLQGIKSSNKGDFTAKINAVFNGLQVDDSPIIFMLITPFDPPLINNFSIEEAHQHEDTLHFDFLNYLEKDQPAILNNSKIFIIVSQWDKSTNSALTVEKYIEKYRPAIHNKVKNSDVSWGQYTVGKLLTTTDESGNTFQELVKINSEYPARFWRRLYNVCTNKDLEKKSFCEKLFS